MNRIMKSNLLAGLVLFSGAALAQTLHQNVQNEPIVDEVGGNCVWNFVHNQLDSDQRDLVSLPELTVSFDTETQGAMSVSVSPNKVNKKVIHYTVTTDPVGSISLISAQDLLDGQDYLSSNGKDKLLYSHHSCDGTLPVEPVVCPCEGFWNGGVEGMGLLSDRVNSSLSLLDFDDGNYVYTSCYFDSSYVYSFSYDKELDKSRCGYFDQELGPNFSDIYDPFSNEQKQACKQLMIDQGCLFQ